MEGLTDEISSAGSQIINNAFYNCDQIIVKGLKRREDLRSVEKVELKDNIELTSAEQNFVDGGRMNFQLKNDAEIYEKNPAFNDIAFSKIGLYKDEYRKDLSTALIR